MVIRVFTICLVLSMINVTRAIYNDTKEYNIFGKIILKEGPFLQYYSKRNPITKYGFVFHNDSLKRNFHVYVTPDLFYNYNKGDFIGFPISNSELTYGELEYIPMASGIFAFVYFCFILYCIILSNKKNE